MVSWGLLIAARLYYCCPLIIILAILVPVVYVPPDGASSRTCELNIYTPIDFGGLKIYCHLYFSFNSNNDLHNTIINSIHAYSCCKSVDHNSQ